MRIEEYAKYDGLGLAQLVAKKEISVEDLLQVAKQAVVAANAEVNAVCEIFEDVFDNPAPRAPADAPFYGVPFLIKDAVLHAENRISENGSRYFEGYRSAEDTHLMQRFRKAGFVTFGRTTTPEMSFNVATESLLRGPTRNPFDTSRMAGGSSGGSGAIVAAGGVPVAHANDGGGSIRIPAACNGLVGLKPSRARTPIGPEAGEGLLGLGIEHVLSKSVRDCAVALDSVSGAAAGDPYTIPDPDAPFADSLSNPPEAQRILLCSEPWIPAQVDSEISQAVRSVARTSEKLGHRVDEGPLDIDGEGFQHAMMAIWCSAIAEWVGGYASVTGKKPTEENLEATTWACYQYGRDMSAVDLLEALQVKNQISRQIATVFENYDLILTPTTAQLPQPLGTYDANASLGAREWVDHIFSFAPFTSLFNMTGNPAISLPLAWSESGLPIGIQFVGCPLRDDVLLGLAGQFEKELPWAHRYDAVHERLLATA